MRRVRDHIGKIMIIGLVGVGLWGFSRGFVFKKLLPVSDPDDIVALGNSVFVEKGLFFPLLIIIGVILLTWYVLYFYWIEEYLWGNKYAKGSVYGLSFFVIYMAAFLEFYHFFNGPLLQAPLAGLADGTPLLLTGLLSGIFLGTARKVRKQKSKEYLTALIWVPILFTIGRTLFYHVIYASPKIDELNSIALIVSYGIAISLSYVSLTQGIQVKRQFLVPILYGLIFFPVSISGNTFICLRYNFPFSPMILLSVIDVLAIIGGGLITEFLNTSHGTTRNSA